MEPSFKAVLNCIPGGNKLIEQFYQLLCVSNIGTHNSVEFKCADSEWAGNAKNSTYYMAVATKMTSSGFNEAKHDTMIPIRVVNPLLKKCEYKM